VHPQRGELETFIVNETVASGSSKAPFMRGQPPALTPEKSANLTSVRPGGGPIQVDSPHGVNGQAAPGGALVMQVETMGKGVQAVLIGGVLLAALLSGMALMRTEATAEQARYTERETKLLREDVRVMSIALARHGVNTDEHSTETGDMK
jgi:hypothetical protein